MAPGSGDSAVPKPLLIACLGLAALALGPKPCMSAKAQPSPREAPALLSPTAAIHVVGERESQVYAAFLSQVYAPGFKDGPLARETLLLENDAMDEWMPRRRAWEHYLLQSAGGQGRAADEAQRAFLKRPQQVLRFYSLPALQVPVQLLRSDVLEGLLSRGGWDAFYAAYPKTQGVLSVSALAFNADGTEALFSARLRCGVHCGYRDLVLMRMVNGDWTLIVKSALP